MLSDIANEWPPTPMTGHKTTHMKLTHVIEETLADLHTPGWWSGIKIIGHGHSHSDAVFEVTLETDNHALLFRSCRWTQRVGEILAFPWPIPARMARSMNIQVVVRRLDVHSAPFHIGLKTYFHEMNEMPAHERYLFMDSTGAPFYHWDGIHKKWGGPGVGDPPAWRTLHRVVPPFELMKGWDDHKIFCLHAWGERMHLHHHNHHHREEHRERDNREHRDHRLMHDGSD
jgi:hypothetical protein